MNNAQFAFEAVNALSEKEEDRSPQLHERDSELVKIIEALAAVSTSDPWHTLHDLVFGSLVETLERRIKSEAGKKEIDIAEIHRLQGQLAWARKYADLGSLTEAFRLELVKVRKQLTNYVKP